MVKIKLKPLFLGIVLFILFINVAYAAGSKLVFSDVDVNVGGRTSKNLVNGDTIDDEAEPGDNVEFRVEVQNNFTDAEDLEIQDITVEVIIEGIDNDDDLEDESKEFDLNQGSDKRVTIKFTVPLEVEEDTFDVVIRAQGEDENGTEHESEMRLKLDVEKETHLLKITRISLSPAELSCNRKNIQLATTTINIGTEDEEDITFQVISNELSVSLQDTVAELTAEPNEEESRFSKIYTFNIPNEATAGSYPVIFRVLYDDNRRKAEETVTLTINDCVSLQKPQATKPAEPTTETKKQEEVEVITPPITGKTTTTTVVQTPPGAVLTQESSLQSNAFVIGIIVAEVVAVIVGIALIVTLFVRRG